MPMDTDTPILPAHIEDTIKAIARFHTEHDDGATPLQRLIGKTTAFAARPTFIAILTPVVLGWIGLNAGMAAMGGQPLDQPPFFWLQGAVSLLSLYMTSMILATQRREDEIAGYREQLTLELAILSEQKSSKIIDMLQALRRDNPNTPNRVDPEADAMSEPADPQAVLDRIKLEQASQAGGEDQAEDQRTAPIDQGTNSLSP